MKNFIDSSPNNPKQNECRDHNKTLYKEILKTQSSITDGSKREMFCHVQGILNNTTGFPIRNQGEQRTH
jgi:hypothetical protein